MLRAAIEAGDGDGIDAALHDDVVFRSPIVYKPYLGRRAVTIVLTTLADVLEELRCGERLERGELKVVVFEARVGAREVDGAAIVRTQAGRVREFTLMVRPLPAVQALADAMRPHLRSAFERGETTGRGLRGVRWRHLRPAR